MGHRNRTTRRRGMVAAAALLAAVGTTLAITPAGATATPGHGAVAAQMCQVTADGVRYRSGPGTRFPALGTVNRGQRYDVYGQENGWANGTVVGVIGNVLIHESFLSC